MLLANQGLLGIAFFEATASIILLVLFLLFRRDHQAGYFRFWLAGWCCFTFSSLCEVALLIRQLPGLHLTSVLSQTATLILFLVAVVQCSDGSERRIWSAVPLIGLILAAIYYIERRGPQQVASIHWETAIFETVICLLAGWKMWRSELARRSHGAQLLAGIFLLSGLYGLDRPLWLDSPLYLLRVAFGHFLGVALGIAMVVVVLEGARTRSEELNDKMRRLTLLTAASTQTLSVQEVIEQVLSHLVESLGATHGIVRLKEGEGSSAQLVARASVGFNQSYLIRHAQLSAMEPWAQRVLKGECQFLQSGEEWDLTARKIADEAGLKALVTLPLPGKRGPLGVIAVGSTRQGRFHPDELSFLVNMANLLGLTLQNVRCLNKSPPCGVSGNIPSIPLATRSWSTIARGAFCAAISGSANCWVVKAARLSAEASWNSSPSKTLPLRVAPTARELPGKATSPIHGCLAISWPPTPRLRIPVDYNSEPCTF